MGQVCCVELRKATEAGSENGVDAERYSWSPQTAKKVPSFAVGLGHVPPGRQRVWPTVEPADRTVTGKPEKESNASAVVKTQGALGTGLLQEVCPANRAQLRGQRDGIKEHGNL